MNLCLTRIFHSLVWIAPVLSSTYRQAHPRQEKTFSLVVLPSPSAFPCWSSAVFVKLSSMTTAICNAENQLAASISSSRTGPGTAPMKASRSSAALSSPPRPAASSSATTIVPMHATSSPTPPRSSSDPFTLHSLPYSSLGLQPSPDVHIKYSQVDGSRRASWTATARSTPASGCADPLRASASKSGKVQYGPGFYIPPPGYQALSMAARNESGARKAGPSMDRSFGAKIGGGATEIEAGRQNEPNYSRPGCCNGSECQQKLTRSASVQVVQRGMASSPKGSLIVWAALGMLLAATQTILWRLLDNKNSNLCIAISFGGLFLELYGVLVAVVGLLFGSQDRKSGRNRDKAASILRKGGSRKGSLTLSLLNSMPSISGFVVCLGAVSQLSTLVIYASQSLDKSIAYSMTSALAMALATTSISFGIGLHRDGHFCSSGRRHPTRCKDKRTSKGQEHGPTLPISNGRPRSLCSSVSSHGGRYVSDYGLESDTDSDDGSPGIKQPRADWMDEVLKDFIRSPLLDMPKRHG